MTYKETLFFIGKCLTISLEERNRIEIENKLKNEDIDWDSVVKTSTAHYVFPALYCNLKKANFIEYVPEDLVEYMKHITNLNRERNQQIIEQAKEINQLLLDNNISPIFLKGTGNLLEGLYEDIAERMVGDIDFIVSKNKYLQVIELLKKNGYSEFVDSSYHFPSFKHHPRLTKSKKIAALEVHKELTIEKYASEFNYEFVKKDSQVIGETNVLSFINQFSLSIIAKQINDDGIDYKNIALRNAYDIFLLSKKTNVKTVFREFDKLKNPLNCFVAICFEVFNKPKSLEYIETDETESYIKIFYKHLSDQKLQNKHFNKTSKKLFINKRFDIIYKSIFDKEYRNWLLKRTKDKNWRREKLIQLGLKKPKPNS